MTTHLLNEGGLARLYSHLENRSVGIVTAFRSRYTLPENRARNRLLLADIKKAGFGVYKIHGRYIEGYGTPNAIDVGEEGFLVIGPEGPDSGQFRSHMFKWGEKYNQDSVLYKAFNDPNAVLLGTQSEDEDGNPVEFPGKFKIERVGTWHPQKIGMFYTKMKNKTFVFEGVSSAPNIFRLWAEDLARKRDETK